MKAKQLSNCKIIAINNMSDLNKLNLKPTKFLITSAFPLLIPQNILNNIENLALNLHPSLLPKWRGPDPLEMLSMQEISILVLLYIK